MTNHPENDADISPGLDSSSSEVDEIREKFVSGWRAGNAPSFEELLEGMEGEAREVAFRQLLDSLFELASGASISIDTDDLRQRFPDMGDVISSRLEETCETMAYAQGATSIRSKTGQAPGAPADPPEVLGRYHLERELGKGGMGTVFLARDTKLDRLVALKVPHFESDDSGVLVERFYREARTMAAINHVNLCTVHDVSEIDGFHCLVMEYVEGDSLSGRLASDPIPPLHESTALVAKLARALQLAHDAGVVHRDLKPSNVLLRRDGEPVLTDFGLARMLFADDEAESSAPGSQSGSLTRTGALIGTPMYMSPEQVEADHDNVGPATDVYSLGVMLYQMITGRFPFEGSVARVLGKIATEEPASPRVHNNEIPERLEAACLKAMSKAPQDRFASAAEFAEELEGCLLPQTEVITTPRGHTAGDSQRNLKSPLIVAAIGAIILLPAILILTFQTESATLVVEIDDPEVEARFAASGITILDQKTDTTYALDARTRQLPPGEYQLKVKSDSGLRLDTNEFKLVDGDVQRVRVTVKAQRSNGRPDVSPKPDAGSIAVAGTQPGGAGSLRSGQSPGAGRPGQMRPGMNGGQARPGMGPGGVGGGMRPGMASGGGNRPPGQGRGQMQPGSPGIAAEVNLSESLPEDIRTAFKETASILTDDFVISFDFPLDHLVSTSERFRAAGFVPEVVRPYGRGNSLVAAMIWQRGEGDWQLAIDLTREQVDRESGKQKADGRKIASIAACEGRFSALWKKTEEEVEWHFIERVTQPDELYSDSFPLAQQDLRPVSIFMKSGQGLQDVTQLWKSGLSNWELVRVRNVETGVTYYDPGDGLLDVALGITGPTTASGMFLWHDAPGVESALVLHNTLADQIDSSQTLVKDGWHPTALNVAYRMRMGTIASTSVWQREVQTDKGERQPQ